MQLSRLRGALSMRRRRVLRRRVLRRVAGGVVLGGATARLLRRMGRDFERRGRLRSSTVVLVYAGYTAHAATLAGLARWPLAPMPIGRAPSRVAGCVGVAGGLGYLLVGAGAFGSLRQLSAVETGQLVTNGIYGWTRNPQYLGFLLTGASVSLLARSVDAAALTAASAVVLDHWVRREEANLLRVFGRPYGAYLDSTARWIGLRRWAGGVVDV